MATRKRTPRSSGAVVTETGDEDGESKMSLRDQEFVKILKETLSAPSQPGGKTSRRVFVAFQVYHENDFPLVTGDKDSKD